MHCPNRAESEFDAEPSVEVMEEFHTHCGYCGYSIRQEDEMYALECGCCFHLLCMLDVLRAVSRGKCERDGLGCVSCRLSRYYVGGCPALHAFGGRVRDAVAICGFLESGNTARVAVRVSSSLEIKGDAGFAKHAKGLELHPVQVVERGRVVRKTLRFGRNASRVECLKEQAGNGGFEREHTEENTS
ncbi:hypothetical protein AVEN_257731-1 [Araneus ventricosus]|uniref:Uncharacterized protein n=1 Tax=Araneus ventricosus TaxID=182803 RepID=A0A4Y2LF36_ARAVE|nr:hypothetical protein AVEN_257731-1 [Araneus ventricosus]